MGPCGAKKIARLLCRAAGAIIPAKRVVLAIILLLFGPGKLPKVMSELGKGLKSFKSSMKDEKDKDKNQD